MIVFRQRGTAQLSPAFGPFAFKMPSFGELVDTTLYVIIGEFTDRRPRVEFSDMRASMPFTDRRPSMIFAMPEVDDG